MCFSSQEVLDSEIWPSKRFFMSFFIQRVVCLISDDVMVKLQVVT